MQVWAFVWQIIINFSSKYYSYFFFWNTQCFGQPMIDSAFCWLEIDRLRWSNNVTSLRAIALNSILRRLKMRGLDRIGSVIFNYKAYANPSTILEKLLIQFISRFKRFESSCWRNQKETFFVEMHFVWTFNGWSDLGLEIHELVCCHEFIFPFSWPVEYVKSKSRFLILNWFQL